ncbi:MAG TPA: ester cyclase [Intrasporangium sp.]|uniref:ester cyclase n=1 Tax=Intrasporangium sp. TaxID=1925024 RepID=UPI002D76F1DC|nr:ester cyclase [Intrasporangium sp.]HET7397448.1 ester cyclase [Intrasporangium sp.]
MGSDNERLAEEFGLVWDVAAPDELADQLFAADVVDHNPQPGQGEGRDGMKQVIALYHGVFPDLHVTNEEVIASGDRAVLRWSATGTHEGDGLGMPATHRQVRLTGIDILRLAEGRIAERWGESNGMEMMQQLTSA